MPLHVSNESVDEVAEVRYPTPGPQSFGDPEAVKVQRAEMGLSEDPSGESDAPGSAPVAESGAPDEKPAA